MASRASTNFFRSSEFSEESVIDFLNDVETTITNPIFKNEIKRICKTITEKPVSIMDKWWQEQGKRTIPMEREILLNYQFRGEKLY